MKSNNLLLALIVTVMIFVAHALSGWLEKLAVYWWGWVLLFVWYFLFMFGTIALYGKVLRWIR